MIFRRYAPAIFFAALTLSLSLVWLGRWFAVIAATLFGIVAFAFGVWVAGEQQEKAEEDRDDDDDEWT